MKKLQLIFFFQNPIGNCSPNFSQVAPRNARERNLVLGVNEGFGVLKATVPSLKNKSSKVEILNAAIEYIKAMRSLLGLEDIQESGSMGGHMDFGDDDGEFFRKLL